MSNFTTYYASFGSKKTGIATVEYAQIGATGSVLIAATTTGVYEVGGGVYGVDIVLEAGIRSLLWNTGEASPVFAQEDMLANFNKQALLNKQHTDPVTGKRTIFEEKDDTTVMVQGDIFEDIAGTTPYDGTGTGIDRSDRMT